MKDRLILLPREDVLPICPPLSFRVNDRSQPSAKHAILLVLVSMISVFAAYQLRWPLTSDLGSPAVGSSFTGFYSVETEADKRFRWTDGNAAVDFPDVGQASQLRLNIKARAWRTETQVLSATVSINGHPIGIIDRAGWRTWTWSISDPAILQADRLQVRIQSVPFSFDELYPDSQDDRILGISVEALQIQPVSHSGPPLSPILPSKRPVLFGAFLAVAAYLFSCLLGATSRAACHWSLSLIAGFAVLLTFFGLVATLYIPITLTAAAVLALNHVFKVRPGVVSLALLPAFLMPLVAIASQASYVRYLLDDFCHASAVLGSGLWAFEQQLYFAWSGRFSSNLALGLAVPLGPYGVTGLIVSLLFIWLALQTWAVYSLRRLFALNPSLPVSVLFASMIVSGTVQNAPDIPATVLWKTGILIYILPFLFVAFYAGVMCWALFKPNQRLSPRFIAISFILALVAAGFQETWALLQICAFLLGAALCALLTPISRKWNLFALLVAGLAGSVIGLLIDFLAPGNALRQAAMLENGFPQSSSWISTIVFSASAGANFVKHSVFGSATIPMILIASALVAIVVPSERVEIAQGWSARKSVCAVALAAILAYLFVVVSLVPAAYVSSSLAPSYALVIPTFVLTCAALLKGYLIGAYLRRPDVIHFVRKLPEPVLPLLIELALVVACLQFTQATLDQIPRWQAYASAWDRRDLEIQSAKQAGARDLTVMPYYNPYDREDIASDPRGWVNKCTSDYYGLNSIRIP